VYVSTTELYSELSVVTILVRFDAMSSCKGYLRRDHGGAAPEIAFWPLEDHWELIRAGCIPLSSTFQVDNFGSLGD